jgi:hypothetical protein
MTVVALARRMYGDGDAWSPKQIRDYLEAEHGLEGLALMTVRRWVVPGQDETERRRNSESYHRRKTAGPRAVPTLDTPAKRLARMRVLRAAGLSYGGIAAVMKVDTGVEMDREQIRHLLSRRRSPGRLAPQTCRVLMEGRA